ncbi:MAG: hypothetical protein AUH29_03185 [Candidatus Rokubacteria bacterium 13_1_40CM_69_27]|nr:MAG: hypothetical protein AUH29_03185 [Candidatus Rokubacteria bacterium 13_1_40CM_69_27]OLC31334.1 MAG: hypothetical protein AUH81_18160 [Candidatus Rokubacteria bacterium 13_1_40CM_4_69_5]
MSSKSASRPRSIVAALLALGMALFAADGLALAQQAPSSGRNASAESLTKTLVALNARYRTAGPAERARIASRLLSVAAKRQQVLLSLVESDPGEALRVALPASRRASLASSVQRYLEKETALEGVLTVLHEDWPGGGRYRYFLHSTSGRYSLHFADGQPTHLLTGARIRVRGVQIGTMLALGGSTSVETVAPAPLPNSFGPQKTAVILANFQDSPTQPYTLADARGVVFGTTSNFFLENSYGQTWLTGDVYGWYTVPVNSTVCDPAFTSYADSGATAAGANLSAYTHIVYITPYNSGCGFSGSATVGGNPSRALINGHLELVTVGHEVGHNLGLLHSHSLVCSDGTSIGPTCTRLEYGDGIDIMGWSDSAHFNAFQKERLGWLNQGVSPPITTVQSSGTYLLDLYEPLGASSKALKILKNTNLTTGYSEWYYVEVRQPLGFDTVIVTSTKGGGLDSNNILNGVVVHIALNDNGGNNNALLDMTPETYQLYSLDPALTVGRSFSDPDAGVTITPVSVRSTGAAVGVALGAPACNTRSTPTVALSPSKSETVPAGTALTYTVSVTNNDGATCPASSFLLQAFVPSDWTAALAPTLTLSPGASASTTLTVTSPTSAAAASYNVTARVMNGSYTQYAAIAYAIYVIGSSSGTGSTLDVSVSTDKPSYTGNQTVSVTAKARSGGSPVSNASVTFAITKSNGTVVSQTASTDSTGSAVAKYRLTKSDPGGAYKARADVAKTPLSGSAAANFTVK